MLEWAPSIEKNSFAVCQLFSVIGNCSPRAEKITSSRSGIRMSVTMSNRAVLPKIPNIALFGRVLQLQESWDLHTAAMVMMTTMTKNIRNILTCEEKLLILSTITWWKGPKHFSNGQKKTFFFAGVVLFGRLAQVCLLIVLDNSRGWKRVTPECYILDQYYWYTMCTIHQNGTHATLHLHLGSYPSAHFHPLRSQRSSHK